MLFCSECRRVCQILRFLRVGASWLYVFYFFIYFYFFNKKIFPLTLVGLLKKL